MTAQSASAVEASVTFSARPSHDGVTVDTRSVKGQIERALLDPATPSVIRYEADSLVLPPTTSDAHVERAIALADRIGADITLRAFCARLEKEHSERFGREVKVGCEPPLPGVVFGFGLDLSRCNGNRRCVEACMRENYEASIRLAVERLRRDPAATTARNSGRWCGRALRRPARTGSQDR